jgi:uncharacterized iron-regulated membrane protein
MRRFIYQVHLILGIVVSIPILAWALSGFLYALPNTVEGGTVENIDAVRIKVSPAEAISNANSLAGKTLPTTALTLLMKDGRPQYQSVGGFGRTRYLSTLRQARLDCQRRRHSKHAFSARLISISLLDTSR